MPIYHNIAGINGSGFLNKPPKLKFNPLATTPYTYYTKAWFTLEALMLPYATINTQYTRRRRDMNIIKQQEVLQEAVKNRVHVSAADNFKLWSKVLLLLGILVEEMYIFK